MRAKRIILMATVIIIAGLTPAYGWVYMSSSGTWAITLDQSYLSGWAGADFVPQIESPQSQVSLSTFATGNWRIDVTRQDIDWPAGVTLGVRTNSISTSGGSIEEHPEYQDITDVQQAFLKGRKTGFFFWSATINLQYSISDLSVTAGAGNFSTTVIYTITD